MAVSPYNLGKNAEILAREWLEARGFVLLNQNYRIKGGEIDLIMESDSPQPGLEQGTKVLHFIEVKSSSSIDEHSLVHVFNHQKKRFLVRTANHFLSYFPQFLKYTIQFDLLFIDTSNRQISLFEDVITVDNYGN